MRTASIKKIILLTALLPVLLSFSRIEKQNDVSRDSLKGKVKSYTRTDYRLKRDSLGIFKFSLPSKEFKEYDRSGNMVLYETLDDSSWQQKSLFKYDGNGHLIENKVYRNPDAQFYKTHDTIGKFIDWSTIWQNIYLTSYDETGRLIDRKTYTKYFTSDSVLTRYTIYNYDSLGNSIQFDSIKTAGINIFKTADQSRDSIIRIPFTRNSMEEDSPRNNNMPFAKQYDKKGHLIRAEGTNNKYDKKGTLREHEILRNGEWKEIFRYNSKRQLTEYIVYFPDGRVNRRYTNSMYKNGVTITNEYNKEGKITEKTISKCKYDKLGNCLIDSTFTNDTLTQIKRQEFEYY